MENRRIVMARKRIGVCVEDGCANLTYEKRCATCQPAYDKATHSGDFRWVYGSREWKALRRQVKREQPWCDVEGCHNMTTDVDHIQPMEWGGAPFDRANVHGLCKMHHSQKTAGEVWGRK